MKDSKDTGATPNRANRPVRTSSSPYGMALPLVVVCLLASVNSWSGLGLEQFQRFLAPSIVLPNDYKCSICLDIIHDPVSVCAAGHAVCQGEAVVLQRQEPNTCPVCRGGLLQPFTKALNERELPGYFPVFEGKGLPASREYLELPYWWHEQHGKSTLDTGLYWLFSLLFQGRDQFPTREQVDDFIGWHHWWLVEGQRKTLDRPLLLTLLGIFRGKGLPSRAQVDDLLSWELWSRVNGDKRVLDRELLIILLPLLSSKDQLPTKEQVDGFLDRDCWRQGDNNSLDRERLMLVSALFIDKVDFPAKEEVERFLGLSKSEQYRLYNYGTNGWGCPDQQGGIKPLAAEQYLAMVVDRGDLAQGTWFMDAWRNIIVVGRNLQRWTERRLAAAAHELSTMDKGKHVDNSLNLLAREMLRRCPERYRQWRSQQQSLVRHAGED